MADQSCSDSPSGSSSSTSSSDAEDDILEPVQILGQTFQLPQDLTENYRLFREFFSMKLWDSLEDHHKDRLKAFLPSSCQNDDEMLERTVSKLFDGEVFKFNAPLDMLFVNLRQGNYRPDIANMRKFLTKSRAKQQKHKMKAYYANLMSELLIERERLLAASKLVPPGPPPKLPAALKLNATDNQFKTPTARARLRYFEELAAIRTEVGGEESDDENYPEGPPIPMKKPRRSGALQDMAGDGVASTISGLDQSQLTLDHLKSILALHKDRRNRKENHPELNTQGITLADIKQRVTNLNGAKKLLFGGQKPEANKLKRPKREMAKAKPERPAKKQDRPSSAETGFGGRSPVQSIKIKNEIPDTESENSSNEEHDSPRPAKKKVLEADIKSEVPDIKYPSNMGICYGDPKIETIKQEPIDPVSMSQTSVSQPVPIKLEDLDGIDMMALPVEIADSPDAGAGGCAGGGAVKQEAGAGAGGCAGAGAGLDCEPDASLMETTYANFMCLVRALFPARSAHRASRRELHTRCAALMRSPIAPLNTWYSLSDDWCAELESALQFLAGERGPHPDDYVPYLQLMPDMQMYQWIGAGRDCDAIMSRLWERWVRARHAPAPAPPSPPSPPPPCAAVPPPRYPTTWTVAPATGAELAEFRAQERRRFNAAAKPFTYVMNGYRSVVGGCARAPAARQSHALMLVADRPRHATFMALVRDAVARLPNGEGTRHHVVTLLRMSQWVCAGAGGEAALGSAVSAALERLAAVKRDPAVKLDAATKLWVYAHRHRSEEDFERMSGGKVRARSAALSPPVMDLEVASVEEVATNGSDSDMDVDVDDSGIGQLVAQPVAQPVQPRPSPAPKPQPKQTKQSPVNKAHPAKGLAGKAAQLGNKQPQAAGKQAQATVKQAQSAGKQAQSAIKQAQSAVKQAQSTGKLVQLKQAVKAGQAKSIVVNKPRELTKLVSPKAQAKLAQPKPRATQPHIVQSQASALVACAPAQPVPQRSPLAKQRPLQNRAELTSAIKEQPVSQSRAVAAALPQGSPSLPPAPAQASKPLAPRPQATSPQVVAQATAQAPQATAPLVTAPLVTQTSTPPVVTTRAVAPRAVADSPQAAGAQLAGAQLQQHKAEAARSQAARSLLIRPPATSAAAAAAAAAGAGNLLPVSSQAGGAARRGVVRVLSPVTANAGKSLISPRALLPNSSTAPAKRRVAQKNVTASAQATTVTVVSSTQTMATSNVPTRTVQLGGRTVQLANQTVQLANQTVQLPNGQTVQLSSGHTLQLSSLQIPTQSVRLPNGQTVQLATPQTVRAVSNTVRGIVPKAQGKGNTSQTLQLPSGQTVQLGQSVQIAGQNVQIAGQNVQIAGQSVQLTGHTVKLPSGQSVQLAGQTVQMPGGQTVQLTGQNVQAVQLGSQNVQSVQIPSGQSVQLGGQTVQLSGQTVQLGQNVQTLQLGGQNVQLGGQTVQLSGQTVQLSGQTVQLPSGQTVELQSGQTVQLPSSQTLQLSSGQTVQLSGQTVQLPSGQTVQLSGQTIQLASGQTVQIAGQQTPKSVGQQVARSVASADKTSQPLVAKLLTNSQGQVISLEGVMGGGRSIQLSGVRGQTQKSLQNSVGGVRVVSATGTRMTRPLLLTSKPLHNIILQQGNEAGSRATSVSSAPASQALVFSSIGSGHTTTTPVSSAPLLKLQQVNSLQPVKLGGGVKLVGAAGAAAQGGGGAGGAGAVRGLVVDGQQLKLVSGRHVLATLLRPRQNN